MVGPRQCIMVRPQTLRRTPGADSHRDPGPHSEPQVPSPAGTWCHAEDPRRRLPLGPRTPWWTPGADSCRALRPCGGPWAATPAGPYSRSRTVTPAGPPGPMEDPGWSLPPCPWTSQSTPGGHSRWAPGPCSGWRVPSLTGILGPMAYPRRRLTLGPHALWWTPGEDSCQAPSSQRTLGTDSHQAPVPCHGPGVETPTRPLGPMVNPTQQLLPGSPGPLMSHGWRPPLGPRAS